MAKEIAKLLRTEMAADVTALPMLAKLLQAYGRKGDKVLAHITPEEAQRLGVVAHQQVLGLLVVVEHHLVGLAADAGLLVPAERRMRGVRVVAVRPDAAGLDLAAIPTRPTDVLLDVGAGTGALELRLLLDRVPFA